jgi:multidrug efflux system outer membrane protein
MAMTGRQLPEMPAMPDAGLPIDLLRRRPDVRAARMRLDSSEWSVNAAQADRLPSLRLSGSYGYSSSDVGELFDNWIAQLAGSLVGPIVDGGRRRAEVRRTEAVADERLAAYKEVILGSIQEVEDALVLEAKQSKHVAALSRQYRAAIMTREEATLRYRKGSESYLSVLASLSSGQRLERQLVDASLARLNYRVKLCRALAGGWDNLDEKKERAENP